MQKSARKCDYHVLYNQDCTNLFSVTKEPITPEHVDAMVDEPACGGADLVLINPNSQRVNYPSNVHQTFWDGYTPGDADFFGDAPAQGRERRKHIVAQMKRLADGGCDYLQRALARCRTNGVGAGISLRMNDHHDTPFGRTHMLSRFFLEHPEYRITSRFRPDGPYAQVEVLDYSHAEVRQYFLALIEELAEGYDFDVLELDFLRFPAYFPEGEGERYADHMSDFVAAAAQTLSRRSVPTRLFVRAPAMPQQARELGLDLGRWVREGWIQGVSAGGQFSTSWRTDLAGYRDLVGRDCALYAYADSAAALPDGIESPTSHRSNTSEWVMGTNPDLFRGFAASAYARGADGVYAFNFFTAREWKKGDPDFSMLGELKDAEALTGQPRTFLLSDAGYARNPISDPPMQVPTVIRAREARPFEVACADCNSAESVEVELIVHAPGKPEKTDFRLYVNEHAAGPAEDIRPLPDADPNAAGHVVSIVFAAAPTSSIQDGGNAVVFRNDGPSVTVVALRIHAR